MILLSGNLFEPLVYSYCYFSGKPSEPYLYSLFYLRKKLMSFMNNHIVAFRKTYKGDHAVGKSNVPKVLVTRVPGTIAFEDVQPMVCLITMLYVMVSKNIHPM